MNDEIGEKWEEWENKMEPYYINEACEKIDEGKSELLDILDKLSKDSFVAGNTSRDKEVRILKDDMDDYIEQVKGSLASEKIWRGKVKRLEAERIEACKCNLVLDGHITFLKEENKKLLDLLKKTVNMYWYCLPISMTDQIRKAIKDGK